LKDFPLSKQIIYATGMMGWSIMINLIGVMLVYFYLPPSTSGLHNLVSQSTFFGVFNILAIILASGRLIDAFYDPFIARMSDKSQNKRGRRIPFMLFSIVPSVIFCILIFYPPVNGVSRSNALWLILPLTLFFTATTTYAIPYTAMLPEIAKTTAEKVRLSTFQQTGFVFGIIIGSMANNIADAFGNVLHIQERMICLQYSIIFLAILGGIAMLIPVLFIDEKKYCHSVPSATPLLKALKESFSNRNFIYFIVACLSYFMAINLILNGLLYFVTVLAQIPESEGPKLMGFMVLFSLLFYAPVNYLVKLIGEKKLMILSFLILAFAFWGISSIGKIPMNPKLQLYLLLGLAAFPLASLGILPNAILADIIDDDVAKTGDNKEGIYVAVNFFSAKVGQTVGITLFAIMTVYGKDPGHDMGLRFTAVCGAVLCAVAALIFFGFKDKKAKKDNAQAE
jgi:GPH family glycoside/pentoside/hexuronide:cation symporter